MQICIVGGIFGNRGADPEKLRITPETTLADGLRERGEDVVTLGHYDPLPHHVDIIHVHHLSYGALRAACAQSPAPFVYTSHDGPSMCGYNKTIVRTVASQFVMARADGVVSLSRAEASFQKSEYTVDCAEHRTIPNGIPRTYSYSAGSRRGTGNPWRLLYVGQLTRLKRVDTLLHAIAGVEVPVHLSLAYHNSATEASLQRLAAELSLGQRVDFLGPCTPEQLAQLYQRSDMLVLPSEAESLPSVVSEALMCGLPVIGSRVGGIPDQVGDFGQLFQPGDVSALRAAITTVCRDYPRYTARAASVARDASERFSVSAMIDKHLALYQAVLRRPAARRRKAAYLPGNIACSAALHYAPGAHVIK